MMLKICGITNREDALAAIDGGAAALGFNFYAVSPRYIQPEEAAAIIAGLPAAVWKVGVFVDESAERILAIARQVGLDVAQLHGNEQPAQYPPGMRVWKAVRVKDGAAWEAAAGRGPAPQVEAVLLDGPASGQTFDWTRAPHGIAKLILAGGLDAGNVRQAIRQVRPWGVDACSQIEYAPGRKDHLKMAAFLKAALEASS
ncbi:MAG TPA: phosphoribosylanthranilate isomerase [Bryobacteraceae bacterium]|nr:phosphoribosylanthranilate isomerase [Bryobacteraceae bacterium]